MIERFIDERAIGISPHWNAALRQCANDAFLNGAMANA
jgi:hypothetical protein